MKEQRIRTGMGDKASEEQYNKSDNCKNQGQGQNQVTLPTNCPLRRIGILARVLLNIVVE